MKKMRSSQNIQVNDHIQLLEENITKKDKEISRLRQGNELLQTNIDELNIELDKLRLRSSNDFKVGEGEKIELKNKIVSYEFKVAEVERKVVSLEEVRHLLEQQVSSVTTELHAKIEQIQKLET